MADEQVIVDIKYDTNVAESNVKDLTGALANLISEQKYLKRELDKGKISQLEYDAALEKNKQQLKEVKTERQSNIKVLTVENKSLKGLKATNSALRKERDKVNLSTKEGKERISQLNKEIDKNDKLIKENSDSMAKQKANIGNYGSALDNLGKKVIGLAATYLSFEAVIKVLKKVATSVRENSQSVSDSLDIMEAKFQATFDAIGRSIASADMSNLIQNIKNAQKAIEDYTKTQDDLGDTMRSIGIETADVENKVYKLREIYTNTGEVAEKRLKSVSEANKLLINLQNRRSKVANKAITAELGLVSKTIGLNKEESKIFKSYIIDYGKKEGLYFDFNKKNIPLIEKRVELEKEIAEGTEFISSGGRAFAQYTTAALNAKKELEKFNAENFKQLKIYDNVNKAIDATSDNQRKRIADSIINVSRQEKETQRLINETSRQRSSILRTIEKNERKQSNLIRKNLNDEEKLQKLSSIKKEEANEELDVERIERDRKERERLEERYEQEKEIEIEHKQNLLNIGQEYLNQSLELFGANTDERLAIAQRFTNSILELQQKQLNGEEIKLVDTAAIAKGITNDVFNYKKRKNSQEIADKTAFFDNQKQLFEGDAKTQEEIELKKKKAIYALELKAFRQNKAQALLNVAINTASAILKIWAEVPKFDFGISTGVLTAIATGIGITQSSLIASKKPPAPTFSKGGILSGPSHKNGGIKLFNKNTGGYYGEAEGREPILTNKVTDNPYLLNQASRINQLAGGAPLVNSSFMQNGGITESQSDSRELINAIKNMRFYIETKSIKTGLSEYDEAANLGNI